MKRILNILFVLMFMVILSGCKKKEEPLKTKVEYSNTAITIYDYFNKEHGTNYVRNVLGSVNISNVSVNKSREGFVTISVEILFDIETYYDSVGLGIYIHIKLLDENDNEIDKNICSCHEKGIYRSNRSFFDVPEDAVYKIIIEE